MKRLLTILCFSAIIVAGTELHQLLKLPLLVQHFKEHQREDKNITLLRFVVIHYFSGSPRDKDYDRDMQLPFKTADCTTLISLAAQPQHIIAERPEFYIERSYALADNAGIVCCHSSDIWQPPKFS